MKKDFGCSNEPFGYCCHGICIGNELSLLSFLKRSKQMSHMVTDWDCGLDVADLLTFKMLIVSSQYSWHEKEPLSCNRMLHCQSVIILDGFTHLSPYNDSILWWILTGYSPSDVRNQITAPWAALGRFSITLIMLPMICSRHYAGKENDCLLVGSLVCAYYISYDVFKLPTHWLAWHSTSGFHFNAFII